MIFQNIIKLLYMTLTNPLSQGVFWGFLYLKGGLYGFFSPSFSNLGKSFLLGFFIHILFWGIIYLLATPRPLKDIAWQNKQKLFDIFYGATSPLRKAFLWLMVWIFFGFWLFVFITASGRHPSKGGYPELGWVLIAMLPVFLSIIFVVIFSYIFLGIFTSWRSYKVLCVKFLAQIGK